MKKASVFASDNVPEGDGWNRTPCSSIHGKHSSEVRIAKRAKCSSVLPPATLSRSYRHSSSL